MPGHGQCVLATQAPYSGGSGSQEITLKMAAARHPTPKRDPSTSERGPDHQIQIVCRDLRLDRNPEVYAILLDLLR